jgi:hypothetical protein
MKGELSWRVQWSTITCSNKELRRVLLLKLDENAEKKLMGKTPNR